MKIGEYEQMMAYLTRPGFKDGTEKIVEPPKSMQMDTTTSNPIPDYDINDFRNDAELFVLAYHNNTLPRADIADKLNAFAQKGVDAGTFSMQDAGVMVRRLIGEVKDRAQKQRLRDVVPEGIGTVDRKNFYAGSSLEEYGSQIKKLYLQGTSSPKINEILGFKNDRSSTIDSFIDSMKAGESPVKISADELANRPRVIGTNQAGAAGQRLQDLQTYISDFKKKNKRLPTISELRKAKVKGKSFDLTATIRPAIDAGQIEVLDTTIARSEGAAAKGKSQILELSKDSRIRNLFKTGDFNTRKTINLVKKILGDPKMTDDVAGGKIHTLAKYFSGELKMEGINPTFVKNAKSIETIFPYKRDLRDVRERLIGESVGEESIKASKGKIRRSDVYKGMGLSDVYSIDEVGSVAGSVNQGSTPYGNFAQIVNKEVNRKDKKIYDSLKARNEAAVKKAIENARANGVDPREDKAVQKAIKKFNQNAIQFEKIINRGRGPNDLKFNVFKISLDEPSKTILNYDNLPESYRNAFDDVYKNSGYSFKVPKNIKTIQEIREDVLNNPNKFSKDVTKRKGGLRIYADIIPGFGGLIENISEDFRQGKYGKGSFKVAGAASIPLAGYFAQEEFRKGDPILDIASTFLTGFKPTESIARTFVPEEKGGYSSAEKLARAQLELLNNPPKSSLDMSPVLSLSQKDPEFTGSPNEYLPYLESKREGIESLATGAEKRFQEQIMGPFREEKAMDRGTLIEGIKTLFNPYQFGPVDPNARLRFASGTIPGGYSKDAYKYIREIETDILNSFKKYKAGGGTLDFDTFSSEAKRAMFERDTPSLKAEGGIMRTGFADGPDDPSKRKFLKIMGGLTALPFVGKFFKVAERAAPLVNKIKTPDSVGKPEWFDVLVNKVIERGTDMTKQFATKEREIVHGTKISDDEYVRVVQDLDDNSVRIEYDSPTNVGQDTVVLEVKPGMMDEATGKKPRDEFVAAETEPRYVGGPEDTDIEFDGENSGPGLMFIESDVSNLKQFATGKKLTKEEAAKAEKRKEFVAKINDDSYEAAQHLAGKYGDGTDIDYEDFIDD